MTTDRLVFLVGLPRSGTTWLGKIFDSHPATIYRHEPDSVERIAHIPLLVEEMPESMKVALRAYSSGIKFNRALKVVGKKPIFPKSYLSIHSLLLYRLGVVIAQLAGRAHLDWPVLGAPDKGSRNDDIVVWKSIESLGRLGAIVEAFPSTHALHIVRHPCGYVASVEQGESSGHFNDENFTSEDFKLYEMLLETRTGRAWKLSMADIKAMDPVERLAWRWAVFNDKALEDTAHQVEVMCFSYESLCEAPLRVARRLIEFAQLEWHSHVERFVNASTSCNESTYYSVFKNPKQSAWGWQDKLPSAKADRIIALARKSKAWSVLEYGKMS